VPSDQLESCQELPPPIKAAAVWDLPVRIFHWLLAGLVLTAGISGTAGGNAMDLHQQAGYGIVVLVVFRVLWGFVGSTYARFRNFVRGIPSTLAYGKLLLRGEAPQRPGHNPLGGWMVLFMLAVLAIQAGTGLFANDDILTEGPLFSLVSKETSDYLSALHKLNFKVLATLAGVHILAIGLYLTVKRINLVRPMITGRMLVSDASLPDHLPSRRTNLFALVLLAAVATAFYLLVLWH